MTNKDIDAILDDLDRKRLKKREIQVAKAKAELASIDREYNAYIDGIYDAAKAIKAVLQEEGDRRGTVNDPAAD